MIRSAAVPILRLWFRWRFEGLEKIPAHGPVLVACNHISYLDPAANAYAVVRAGRVPRFIAKRELFEVPALGALMRSVGQIPVSRGTGNRSALDAADRALRGGELVVIYPEGTVTKRPDHLPMEGRTGVARLALSSGLPVTPMAGWGSHPVWQKSGPGSLRPGRPIWVKVGDPIRLVEAPVDEPDYDALKRATATVMDALTELVLDMRGRYPRQWAEAGG